MSTANLSVGIHTEGAKASMLELKRWLASEMSTVMVKIDPTSLDKSVQDYLNTRKTFHIKLKTKELRDQVIAELGDAVHEVFNKQRILNWNQLAFAGGVKSAVDGAFGKGERRLNWRRDDFTREIREAAANALIAPFKVNLDSTAAAGQIREAVAAALTVPPLRVTIDTAALMTQIRAARAAAAAEATPAPATSLAPVQSPFDRLRGQVPVAPVQQTLQQPPTPVQQTLQPPPVKTTSTREEVDALKKELDARVDALRKVKEERRGLLSKDGRVPNRGPKVARYEELGQEYDKGLVRLHEADRAWRTAKSQLPPPTKDEVNAIAHEFRRIDAERNQLSGPSGPDATRYAELTAARQQAVDRWNEAHEAYRKANPQPAAPVQPTPVQQTLQQPPTPVQQTLQQPPTPVQQALQQPPDFVSQKLWELHEKSRRAEYLLLNPDQATEDQRNTPGVLKRNSTKADYRLVRAAREEAGGTTEGGIDLMRRMSEESRRRELVASTPAPQVPPPVKPLPPTPVQQTLQQPPTPVQQTLQQPPAPVKPLLSYPPQPIPVSPPSQTFVQPAVAPLVPPAPVAPIARPPVPAVAAAAALPPALPPVTVSPDVLAALNATLTQALVPTLDRMAQTVADAVKNAAPRQPRTPRRQGPPTTPPAGGPGGEDGEEDRPKARASRAFSYLDRRTGEKLGYSEPLPQPDETLADIQKRLGIDKGMAFGPSRRELFTLQAKARNKDAKAAAAQEKATNDLLQQSSNETFRIRQRVARQDLREGMAFGPSRRELFTLQAKARHKDAKAAAAQEKATNDLLQQSSNETFRIRQRVARQDLKEGMAFGPSRKDLYRLQDQQREVDVKAAAAQEKATNDLLQQSSNETFRIRQRVARQDLREGMAFGPSRRELFTLQAKARHKDAKAAAAQEKATNDLLQQSSNETFRIRQRVARQDLKEGMAFGPSRKDLYRLQDQQREVDVKAAAAQEKATNDLLQQSSNETFRIRQRVARQDLKEGMAFGPRRKDIYRLQAQQRGADIKAQEKDLDLDTRFAAPGAKDEIARLTTQVRMASGAMYELDRGRLDRALSRYGESAVAAVPQLAAMRAQLDALRIAKERDTNATNQGLEALRRYARGVQASATFAARGKLDNQGARLAGIRAMIDDPNIGPVRARALVNNDEMFKAAGGSLDGYTKRASTAAATNRVLSATMRDAHSAARGLAGSLGAVWLTWGATVPLAGFAAMGGALRSVWSTGRDLEYQLTMVKVLSDGAAVSTEGFTNAVRGSLVAPVQAAQALRGLAQNGLNAKEALAALPPILALATAGEMDLNEAALGATGVMAAFNLQVGDLGRISDVFAFAASESNTSVAAMVESMKQASTVADQYKVSLDETAASLAILAKRNIMGTAAGTAFRNMMSELAAPSDKASRAMKQLKLDLYDANKQLKTYPEVMEQLRNATVMLNEKGRLAFLQDIFDERGAKAANALLSDFDKFNGLLKELKENSKGFSQSFVDTLSETTTGKVKRIYSEFQLETTRTFDGISAAVRNSLDELILGLRSSGFREGLTGLAEEVVNVTRFLIEHHKAIMLTVGGWFALRVAISAYAAIESAVKALKALEFSLLSIRAAALSAGTALTGGLSLVALLAAEYFLLRKNTDEAAEALKAKQNAVINYTEQAERNVEALKSQSNLLRAEIDLYYQGKDAIEAKLGAQKRVRQEKLADARLLVAEAQKKLDAIPSAGVGPDGKERKLDYGMQQRRDAAQAVVDDAKKNAAALEAAIFSQDSWSRIEEELNRRKKLIGRLEAYLKDAAHIGEKSKGKIELPTMTRQQAERMSDDALEAWLDRADARRNKEGKDYKKADSGARKLENQEVSALIAQLKREEDQLKRTTDLQEKLDAIRFNSDRYGPYLQSVLSDQRAQRMGALLIEQEISARNRLLALKSKLTNLDDADKKKIDAEIEARSYRVEVLREELQGKSMLSRANIDEEGRKQKVRKTKILLSLEESDRNAFDEIGKTYDKKVENPGDIAVRKHVQDVEKEYVKYINESLVKINDLEDRRTELINSRMSLDLVQAEEVQEQIDAVTEQTDAERALLKVIQDQAEIRKKMVETKARDAYEKSITAEAGMRRFWQEYVEQAETSAEQVYQIMKSSTDKMGDALADFVTTGKLNFKSLVASILSDVVKMMAKKEMAKFMNMAADWALNAFTPASGIGNASASLNPEQRLAFKSADGNVMTSQGPLELNKFARGGIAREPMISMIGEGTRPEAYVPLPDGRTIPVTLEGASGGGVVINQTINVHSDGSTEVSNDVSGDKAAQLGRFIEAGTMAVIVRERRPGGMLYAKA